MTWQNSFKIIIRVVFLFAYVAFLAASIRHVATFFHNFEADRTDWANPYTLAVSIDLTALVLTVGVMFFRQNMPWYAQGFTWVFIVALTAFSWFVNWEYAKTFQGNDLHVDDTLRMLNPILASSFAFLNLAYSVVAEFFSKKTETAVELAAKVNELEEIEEQQKRLAEYKERNKKPSVISRIKDTALEAKQATQEVLKSEEKATVGSSQVQISEPVNEPGSVQNVEVPDEKREPLHEPQQEHFVPAQVPQTEPNYELLDEPQYEPGQELLDEPQYEHQEDFVSTDKHEVVSNSGSLRGSSNRRITVKLNEPEMKQERNTDKLNQVQNKPKTKRTPKTSGETDTLKKVRSMVRKKADITPTEISRKLKITPQHAGRMKTQVLSESVPA